MQYLPFILLFFFNLKTAFFAFFAFFFPSMYLKSHTTSLLIFYSYFFITFICLLMQYRFFRTPASFLSCDSSFLQTFTFCTISSSLPSILLLLSPTGVESHWITWYVYSGESVEILILNLFFFLLFLIAHLFTEVLGKFSWVR